MKPGDIVQLVSGGPPMTIAAWDKGALLDEPGWLALWSIQGALKRGIFPEVVLRPYDPEKPLATHTGRPKGS